MIYNYSDFFSNHIKAYLHCNPDKKKIKDIINEFHPTKNISIPQQIHSNNVLFIKQANIFSNTDGLITSNQKLILALKVADCVPIYLYDVQNKNFGLIHSGWRGTIGKIVLKGIYKMLDNNSKIQNIKVLLGPCIKDCCYEVDYNVSKYFHDDCKIKVKDNKWMIDLHKTIKNDLLEFGIDHKNIKSSDICTLDTEHCHSYRRNGEHSGRMIGIMGNI